MKDVFFIEEQDDPRDMAVRQTEEYKRLEAVALERWKHWKETEKLIGQLEKALKAILFIAKSEPGPVPTRLRRDIREAEKVLEIVASRKRAKRSRA